VTDPGKAVFLSYASQDAETAQKLRNALRAAGVEVWFDQTELRGGDSWDQMIRRQIKACYLFVPMISANTQSREEGYFRREWNLAVTRTLDMAEDRAFLLPVVIDDTADSEARVPEKFREVQWTRIPEGNSPDTFVEHVRRLTAPETGAIPPSTSHSALKPTTSTSSPRSAAQARSPAIRSVLTWIVIAVLILGIGYLLAEKFLVSKRSVPVAESVSDKSVAVLPFADMSEKKDQEYFSDGLSEELIGLLSKVPELKVPARTSSFYFKGKQATIADIARTLGVAYVLEGSVRRSGNTLRITAQLIRADNGYEMWSESFDRKLDDIFRVQDEISSAVVKALKLSLLGGAMPKAKPISNREAYDLFLQARSLHYRGTYDDVKKAIAFAQRAVDLDASFAPAWASIGDSLVYEYGAYGGDEGDIRARAYSAAASAIKLDPDLADGHLAMARVLGELDWNWTAADAELQSALALEPNYVLALGIASSYALTQGRIDEALRLAQKAVYLDAASTDAISNLGDVYYQSGRFSDAVNAYRRGTELNATHTGLHLSLGIALLASGDPAAALETMKQETDDAMRQYGLALAFDAARHRGDADRALAALETNFSDTNAEQIASIYACRGLANKAFAWLDRSLLQREGSLTSIKLDPCVKYLRPDPRLKVLLGKLNLPQ